MHMRVFIEIFDILECPKYLATNVILAPLSISSEAQLCLKSCTLISLTHDINVFLIFIFLGVVSHKVSNSPNKTLFIQVSKNELFSVIKI